MRMSSGAGASDKFKFRNGQSSESSALLEKESGKTHHDQLREEIKMDNFEKVEKIREKTGVSYEEAKAALEANNYDLLDAVIYLEKQGKAAESNANYSTGWDGHTNLLVTETQKSENKKQDASDSVGAFFAWVGNLIKKAWENKFVIEKEGKEVGQMPVLVLIFLLFGFFWVVIPLLIVGLFFDFRYGFKGGSKIEVDLNEFCDKAKNAANDIRNDFRNSKNNNNNNNNNNQA